MGLGMDTELEPRLHQTRRLWAVHAKSDHWAQHCLTWPSRGPDPRGVCVCICVCVRMCVRVCRLRHGQNKPRIGVNLDPGSCFMGFLVAATKLLTPRLILADASCSACDTTWPNQTYNPPKISLGKTLPKCHIIKEGQKGKKKVFTL